MALPPANNPKLLFAKSDTPQQNGNSTALGHEDRVEEPRFPPKIQLGRHVITTWYSAPYPSEYARLV